MVFLGLHRLPVISNYNISTVHAIICGMYGIHYSPRTLLTGECLRSTQSKAQSFDIVWPVYKAVADELGLYFPKEYGYAYPIDKTDLERFGRFSEHFVFAPDAQVTRGNYHYSVYVTMSSYISADRALSLKDRLVERTRLIRERAFTYFTEISSVNACELISDVWTVQDI
jgi:hypothetical protein